MDDFLKMQETDDKPVKCSICGQSLSYIGHGEYECNNLECKNIERDSFGMVRKFLEDNGPSPAAVIAKGTGVPLNKITKYFEEGRLELFGK